MDYVSRICLLICIRISLQNGHIRMVQSSLLGSILVNLLLGLGASLVINSFKRKDQPHNGGTDRLFISLMTLTVFSFITPVINSQYSHFLPW